MHGLPRCRIPCPCRSDLLPTWLLSVVFVSTYHVQCIMRTDAQTQQHQICPILCEGRNKAFGTFAQELLQGAV